MRQPLHTPTRSAVGFGWEIAPGPHASRSTEIVHHQEGFTPRNVFRRPKTWVPRSCQADVESLECGDRIRRTASSTSPDVTKPDHRTQRTPICHISITAQRNATIPALEGCDLHHVGTRHICYVRVAATPPRAPTVCAECLQRGRAAWSTRTAPNWTAHHWLDGARPVEVRALTCVGAGS